MSLYDAWKRIALDQKGQPVKHVWDEFSIKEKAAFAAILRDKTTEIKGTVAETAEKYRMSTVQMSQFLDGINECVDDVPHNDVVEETTELDLKIDFTRLYKQMVEYKAEPLYTLPEWDGIFTKEEQKTLYSEQKRSHTVIRNEEKVGRNDPCPCNSGKKYKKCCGAA